MSKSLIITKGVSVPLAPADVTPGEILLEEFMKPLGLSGNALAKKLDVDPMRISQSALCPISQKGPCFT
jgi:antitoxin HigA-1